MEAPEGKGVRLVRTVPVPRKRHLGSSGWRDGVKERRREPRKAAWTHQLHVSEWENPVETLLW